MAGKHHGSHHDHSHGRHGDDHHGHGGDIPFGWILIPIICGLVLFFGLKGESIGLPHLLSTPKLW